MTHEEMRARNNIACLKYRKAHPNPERVNATRARYVAAHPDEVKATNARSYLKNRPARQESKRKKHASNPGRRYGLSAEQVTALRDSQNGCCAICTEKFVKTPRIDHDHSTGAVRGMLCHYCNLMLGHAKDEVERLESGAAYLRQHSATKLTLLRIG